MTDDALIADLRRWGSTQVYHLLSYEERHSALPEHPIEKARQHAPGTRERALQTLVGRDGTSRRRIVAKAAGIAGMGIAPKWSTDPIPCHGDGGYGAATEGAAIVPDVPDDLRWIDAALARLAREAPMLARIVREEFTGQGTQRTKAEQVAREYGAPLSLWQYRRALERGLAWIAGRRAAA